MGTFICDKCKKQWPDVAYQCCPDCRPCRAWVHTILGIVVILAVGIAEIVAIAWLVGLLL